MYPLTDKSLSPRPRIEGLRVRWTFLHLDLHWAPSNLLLRYSLSQINCQQTESIFFSPMEQSLHLLFQPVAKHCWDISSDKKPLNAKLLLLFITTPLLDLTVGLDKTSQFILQKGKIMTAMKFTELLCWPFPPKILFACGASILVTYSMGFILWMLTIPVSVR